ncbi:hypothetical protein BN439_3021 [Erwinia amylovora Ea644]|nr:hypothetical protein BN439_3021 [Erwinia amylovora Ea644]CCP08119.1 hypothetical protein BN440_3114 [Erwinia amylovora MR1]
MQHSVLIYPVRRGRCRLQGPDGCYCAAALPSHGMPSLCSTGEFNNAS